MTAQLPSKERLEKIASMIDLAGPDHILGFTAGEVSTMARALLAAYEQEPVAYMYRDNLHTDARFSLEPRFGNWSTEDIREYEISETPLYANPAPSIPAVPDECPKCNGTGMMDSGGVQPWGELIKVVCDCRYEMPTTAPVVPDCFHNAVSALESLYRNGQKQNWNERYTTDMAYASGVLNACRAAMLNGGNPSQDEYRNSLQELVKAMRDYEMDVGEPAPYKHRAMMKRAEALLNGGKS